MKLFDTMVKPILLYCSEIWGGFDIKRSKPDSLLMTLMTKDKTWSEKLNIRMCKQTIRLPKSACNMAARAELGRIPVMKSVIVAFCKYYVRLHSFKDDDLLFHALQSQENFNAINGSGRYFTYSELAEILIKDLGVPKPDSLTEDNIFDFAYNIKQEIILKYKAYFQGFLREIRQSGESKLGVYAHIKKSFDYEYYLDKSADFASMARFRTSCHWLPIERGRYCRPIIPRNLRVCTLCHTAVGSEFHAMFKCQSKSMLELRTNYMNKISNDCPQISGFADKKKFVHLLACKDLYITPLVCNWVKDINQCFKNVQ